MLTRQDGVCERNATRICKASCFSRDPPRKNGSFQLFAYTVLRAVDSLRSPSARRFKLTSDYASITPRARNGPRAALFQHLPRLLRLVDAFWRDRSFATTQQPPRWDVSRSIRCTGYADRRRSAWWGNGPARDSPACHAMAGRWRITARRRSSITTRVGGLHIATW